MISVRLARDSDTSFIDALGSRTALGTLSAVRDIPERTAVEAFHRLASLCRERLGTVTFVAEEHNEPVGFLILLTDLPDDATQLPQGFVAYVAVDDDKRRKGVGRALMRAAAQESRKRGLPYLSLMVSANNDAAVALYRDEDFHDERILMTKVLRGDRRS